MYSKYNLKKSHSNNKNITSLYNRGVMCINKREDTLEFRYYPLNSSCISSSKIDWKLLGFNINTKDNKIVVESYALYRQNNLKLNSADCGGAGVKTKKIQITSQNSIYWGNRKLIDIKNIKNRVCFRQNIDSIYRVDGFK
jgi:hypothetical protein